MLLHNYVNFALVSFRKGVVVDASHVTLKNAERVDKYKPFVLLEKAHDELQR